MSSITVEELLARVERLEEKVFHSSHAQSEEFAPSGLPDWNVNARAFVNRYAKGKNGTKKFVLLLAFLSKGDENKTVDLKQIEILWSKMTAASLLGVKFNRKYSTEAKTKGWVDTPKTGAYHLSLGWTEVLDEET